MDWLQSVLETSQYDTTSYFCRSYNYFKSIYLRAPLYVAINVTLLLAVFEKPALQPLSAPYWVSFVTLLMLI